MQLFNFPIVVLLMSSASFISALPVQTASSEQSQPHADIHARYGPWQAQGLWQMRNEAKIAKENASLRKEFAAVLGPGVFKTAPKPAWINLDSAATISAKKGVADTFGSVPPTLRNGLGL
ncbi:hypothetical protein HYFRA_00003917 [Hymenoscyphus fraxineus]|uniref:Uncharacterized protein n=1 Tax=Hymenoscyphus fraxineus TaxID=746836 RepID=A0A9N9KY35_9HELO|nr:hypothetical protein HYFRA_00003917 [Hymenoscyphus fraxineus]